MVLWSTQQHKIAITDTVIYFHHYDSMVDPVWFKGRPSMVLWSTQFGPRVSPTL